MADNKQPFYVVTKDGQRVGAAVPLDEANAEAERLRKQALTESTDGNHPLIEVKLQLNG